jgi:hypothetical protein
MTTYRRRTEPAPAEIATVAPATGIVNATAQDHQADAGADHKHHQ